MSRCGGRKKIIQEQAPLEATMKEYGRPIRLKLISIYESKNCFQINNRF